MVTPAAPASLTTTSYAILGLLAVKPWTTYELAQQMRRALGQFWPRAESKLYEEPKKLVAHGLARATKETTGKRPRTVYSITAKGRRAMAAWVPQPGAGPVLEFEALVKLFYAEHGTKQDILATLDRVRAWSDDRHRDSAGISQGVPRRRRRIPRAPAVARALRPVPRGVRHHGGALDRVGSERRRDVARRHHHRRARARRARSASTTRRGAARTPIAREPGRWGERSPDLVVTAANWARTVSNVRTSAPRSPDEHLHAQNARWRRLIATLTLGPDAIVVLKDVCHLDDDAIIDTLRWAATALLRAAIDD